MKWKDFLFTAAISAALTLTVISAIGPEHGESVVAKKEPKKQARADDRKSQEVDIHCGDGYTMTAAMLVEPREDGGYSSVSYFPKSDFAQALCAAIADQLRIEKEKTAAREACFSECYDGAEK